MKAFYIRCKSLAYETYTEHLFLPSLVTCVEKSLFGIDMRRIILKENWEYKLDSKRFPEKNCYVMYLKHCKHKIGKAVSSYSISRWISEINKNRQLPSLGGLVTVDEEQPTGIDDFIGKLTLGYDIIVDKRMLEIGEELWKPKELIFLDTI